MSAPGERTEDGALVLDGRSLTIEDVARVARDPAARVTVGEEARERVRAARRRIEEIVARYREDYAAWERGERSERPVQDYGITTGFGEFKDVPVEPERLEELQQNLLRSHCVGVGEPRDADDPSGYFAPEVVRATLLIRANAFLGGYSGVREELLDTVLALLHAGVVPLVPTKGSLGSSGDLCPLAHCFAVLLGEGRYVVLEGAGDDAGDRDDLSLRPREAKPARDLPGDLEDELDGGEPALPSYKEGLALINGATVSTALLALAAHDAGILAATADLGAALSLEAACGCARAFDPRVHAARGHAGQIESAARIRELVAGSRLVESAGAVQDAYSLRCAPVVHGPARDALAHVRRVVETEMNAATDNPLFFDDEDVRPWDHEFAENWPRGFDGRQRASYSAGNFHGQPIAQAADHLAMACAELGNVSERRIQLLLDHHHNRNLPANLVAHRGVRSGAMLLQYSAASLVTESRGLCHPASVDSIPTAANIEDHVAVATWAARKLCTVLANVEAVLAIELLVAAQAVDWRVGMGFPPVAPAETGEGEPPGTPARPEDGRAAVAAEAERFEQATREGRRPGIAARLGRGTGASYLRVRDLCEPIFEDRVLADDVRRLRRAVAAGDFAGPPADGKLEKERVFDR